MVKTFCSTRNFGPMTSNPRFYKDATKDEIKKDLLARRMILGSYKGFDGTKILVPLQNTSKHKEGHFEDVTEFISDTLEVSENKDLWNYNIPCDVLLIRSSLKGVALACPVADCPVIMATDGDIFALAHSGAREIDRLVPFSVVDALTASGAKLNNIGVVIGPSAGSETYIYEQYPTWATKKNNMWKHCIKEDNDGFKIDLKKAIIMQLVARGIEIDNIKWSREDTITNPNYYSNYAANHGKPDKDGRFLVGGFFTEEKTKVLVKTKQR